MDQRQINSLAIESPISRFDTVIEALMVALLAFMPLAFGVVHAWSEEVVICLAGAMALCLALKLIVEQQTRLTRTWAYLPIVLFLLLVVFQLLPLPISVLKLVSPHTAETKMTLLQDLPGAAEIFRNLPLTFYPHATEHNLRLVLAVAAVFLVTVNVYRRPNQIKRLLIAITLIGGGVALLALAQVVLGNGKIYWTVAPPDQAYSGPFVNHNHYGQFMNLSIGAALGLLLVKLSESFREREVSLPEVAARLGDPELRMVWFAAGMMILGAATIFISLTRGGMISMLIAAGFTAVLMARKRSLKGRGWIIATMALASFICVLYIGFDAVYDRLATLRHQHNYKGRLQILQDLSVSVTRFPSLGTGLGTHEVVYTMFDRSTIGSLASHAENEYAQVAEETGAFGLALALVFIIFIWRQFHLSTRHIKLPIRAAAFGLGFGLLAIMIHSLSDFGQHLPANACLTAVFCGLLVSLARLPGDSAGNNPDPSVNPTSNIGGSARKLGIVSVVAAGAIWVWALSGADAARVAAADWEQAAGVEERLVEQDWLGSNEEYAEIILSAQAAVERQPKNIHYRHWLNVYRWHSISRVTDPNGMLVMTPQSLEYTRTIVDELHQARALCPTFGATWCVAGQLEKFILEDPVGDEHIQTGYKLAPCDATACFVAGLLDAQAGNFEGSLVKWGRALQLNSGMTREVMDVYIHEVNRPDLAVAIAGEDLGRLSEVARSLSAAGGEHQELAAQARAEVTELLKAKCAEPDAPASALASLAGVYRREQDHEMAAEYYGRALDLDYGQVGWRLARAQCLAETERVNEAMKEAKICLRLRPQMAAARKLVADLSIWPGITLD